MHGSLGTTMRLSAFFALLAPMVLLGQQPNNPQLEQLSGRTFALVSVAAGENTIPLPAKPAITMKFGEAGKVSGSAPINLYMGSIELTEDGALSWGPAGLAVTRKAGPPMLMELESLFFEAIERTTSLTMEGGKLVFSSTEPAVTLVFEEQALPAALADYHGRLLTVTYLSADGVSYTLPGQPKLNLVVNNDGRCAGFSGVNRFFGKFEIAADGSAQAGHFGSTMMAGPEDLMKLEQAYLKALGATSRIEFAGGAVRFLNSQGIALIKFEVR